MTKSEYSMDTPNRTHSRPLQVLIAGAGIGGLAAAIALRQAGHHVKLSQDQIFESSRFAMELGAAIHLPPNVQNVLHRFGLNPSDIGATDTEWVSVYDKDGGVISHKSVAALREVYGYPWQLCHRVDLHEALKRMATSSSGIGFPATLFLLHKVVDCNPSKPSLTLSSGEEVCGDLIIGADGVHSSLRTIVTGDEVPAHASGGSAFRFLVPIAAIKDNPKTAHLVEKTGELQLREGNHRRLVVYPCRRNTELNFVCLHPDTESTAATEGWNNGASVEQVVKVFDEFADDVKALLAMADPSTVKLWRLYDRPALSTWISGNVALLGDAAHPFLPHQGQGGAQAIEDGAALGALLPTGTTTTEIPERLKLYMKCRYDRATMVQDFSRQMAFKVSEEDKIGGYSLDPMEFSKINFSHDAYAHAESALRRQL